MFRTIRATAFSWQNAQRAHAAFRAVRSQPGWIQRAALLTVLLFIGVPILLVVFIALAAGTLVLGVLAGLNVLLSKWRGPAIRNHGRENVRVIQRADSI